MRQCWHDRPPKTLALFNAGKAVALINAGNSSRYERIVFVGILCATQINGELPAFGVGRSMCLSDFGAFILF